MYSRYSIFTSINVHMNIFTCKSIVLFCMEAHKLSDALILFPAVKKKRKKKKKVLMKLSNQLA